MTHLGLGSSLEEPWGYLLGGRWKCYLAWEVVLTSWEAWVDLWVGGHLLPCFEALVMLLA